MGVFKAVARFLQVGFWGSMTRLPRLGISSLVARFRPMGVFHSMARFRYMEIFYSHDSLTYDGCLVLRDLKNPTSLPWHHGSMCSAQHGLGVTRGGGQAHEGTTDHPPICQEMFHDHS